MKNKQRLISSVSYLSGIIFLALLFIQIKSMNCYANEAHNKQTESVVRDPNRLWCNEHGVYEDECLICHPESGSNISNKGSVLPSETENKDESPAKHQVEMSNCCSTPASKEEKTSRNPKRLWCNQHNVYEDECYICHPELKPNKSEVPSGELYCEEHRVSEQECGICHPELTDSLLPGKGLKVRLESTESAIKAGVVTAFPDEDKPSSTHSVLCQITYNMNHLARITPLTSGVIRRVLVDIGAYVSKDDILVEIASPEIANAKADYLTALTNETLKELVYKREKGLFGKRISSQREYQEVQAEYQVATNNTNTRRQQLLNYGFTEAEVKEIVETRSSSSILPIRAPFSGTIIERSAVTGEVADPGNTLFSLADLSTMWLEISIPEYMLSSFKVGDTIEADFNSLPEIKLHGDLIWLASNIEEESRMLKARAMVKNPDSLLKHGMFGQVSLLSEQFSKVLYLPVESIQRFNKKSFLFVELSDDLYEIRRVVPGSRKDEKIEIIEGISIHEKVVVTGSFTLKSEFLKSRLGEGCVHE
ncbi:secretion protein HlyD [Candidatus Scalindua japonica]|uniref:Secretion protein HlyD n=1 Tax=Candidatus Scalindua japonica TaxID=1284222 RepID=A0A286U3W9_9BACT|nr:efflux RND transporter periplasmic adaptor subunit [Candidatus Scalindua japonica]GAX62823.1 secretion protein HlyD [Candidatus Scalindua japonica]